MMSATLRKKLLWLIGGRAAAITVLLGSAILIQIKSPGALPIDPFFFLIGLTYGLTMLYAVLLKRAEQHRWLIDMQLGGDAIIVSAIVHLTGGVGSYFSSLYALPIIAAATIQSWRGGLMVAILSSVVYGGVVAAQYFGTPILPVVLGTQALPPQRVALFTVGLNVFGFFAVAGLSGYLAEGLRRADAQLERASNQLADLQAFSQHVIDSLTSGLVTADATGRILTFNRAAEAITSVAAVAAVGRAAHDVLQLPAECALEFGDALRGAVQRVDYSFTRGDGRQIEVGLAAAPLITPRGENGFLFTFQDVTQTRRLEREARVQQRLAAVGEMAAGIAHEIRNPLASMSGSMQILRQELPLTEEQSQLMDIVLRESERLNETIRSFLAYARPHRATAARVDVRQVITDTARLLQNSSELSRAHRIGVEVPDSEVPYHADEGQIRQVVWNLATNGLRAMPDGGQLTLSVQRVPADSPDAAGEIIISVQDQGIGIPPEELEGIFQPFHGAFVRGTGLGLSIVHRIVTDYGGEVKVSSHMGHGTTMMVKLPLPASSLAAPLAARTN